MTLNELIERLEIIKLDDKEFGEFRCTEKYYFLDVVAVRVDHDKELVRIEFE